MALASTPHTWLQPRPDGLYCSAGDFWIDPHGGKERALVTHGHADHARPGHNHVLATSETLAIMKARYGKAAGDAHQSIGYGEVLSINGVDVSFYPAGHVLGSAQILLEHEGQRIVVSGDYKRRRDPTCAPFEPIACDVFITEATFGLPVFTHPDTAEEVAKILAAKAANPERTILVGAYALGKCQRVIRHLREAGYDKTIYLHGAMVALCELYETLGVSLGPLKQVNLKEMGKLPGEIILCPPGQLADRWARRFADPISAFASGWMRVRQRAKQRGVELPLIISDHADWNELTETIEDISPGEVWVTHGREDALVHWCTQKGIAAQALSLVGRGEDPDES
ncbi:MAG: ligase-associated DNA damage response exonuclease [Pseudomonadota bacterium]